MSLALTPEVGRSWQPVDDPDLVSGQRWGSMSGVAAGGPGAIAWGAVYLAGPRIWTTVDGRDWTLAAVEAPTDAEPDGPGEVLDVTAGGPGYVAVGVYLRPRDGNTSIVWTSVDGQTWQRIPFGPVFQRSFMDQVIAWQGGLLAFGCENVSPTDCGPSRVWTSPDGITWTRATPALPDGLVSIGIVDPAEDIVWGTGDTYAEGDWPEPIPRPTRLTSLDGLTWTISPLPVLGIERLHPLPGGLYLTVEDVAAGGRDVEPPPAWMTRTSGVYRSVDQATWEPLVVGRQPGMEIIAVGDTLIMVGNDAKNRPTGWRSTDAGVTWQAARPGGGKGTMSSVAALPDGTLVAVGRLGIREPSTAAWISPPIRP